MMNRKSLLPRVREELISADDLGLTEIDYLADSLPQAFSAAAPLDPLSFQKEKVQELAPYLSPAAVTKIAECLAKYTVNLGDAMHDKQASALLVLASDDTLLGYAMEMVAKSGGVCLTAAGTGADVEAITEHALCKRCSGKSRFRRTGGKRRCKQ